MLDAAPEELRDAEGGELRDAISPQAEEFHDRSQVVACSAQERSIRLELSRLQQLYAGDLELEIYDDGDLTTAARGHSQIVRPHYGEPWAAYVTGQPSTCTLSSPPTQLGLLGLRATAADAAVVAGAVAGSTGSGVPAPTAENIHPWFTGVLGSLRELCTQGREATRQQLDGPSLDLTELRERFVEKRSDGNCSGPAGYGLAPTAGIQG